jgi:23S rRNA pseudouridine1911/1915/1917 synthase
MAPPPESAIAVEPLEADDAADPAALEAEQRRGVVTTGARGERLDKWLVSLAGEFSRNHLQTLIEGGQVSVDGQVVTGCARRVGSGQQVVVTLLPTPESRAFRPEPMTLLNGLLAHHAGAAALPRAGIVHRLDKDTSGLMVVAKTLPAMTALVRAIAAREVRREYLALAHGVLRTPALTIDAPIGRDPVSRIKMAVVAGGKPARTDVALLGATEAISALRCTLHTGRTHQIRVHLASRGHALLADPVYGGREALGLTRQALHAHRLGFAHPLGGAALAFVAPLPPDLQQAWLQVAPGTDG